MVAFNPKDPNTFASASLDRSVKVWGLSSSTPTSPSRATRRASTAWTTSRTGTSLTSFSGADDRPLRCGTTRARHAWTLEGHTHNVSSALFHPELPLIITGSEDGTVRVWNGVAGKVL